MSDVARSSAFGPNCPHFGVFFHISSNNVYLEADILFLSDGFFPAVHIGLYSGGLDSEFRCPVPAFTLPALHRARRAGPATGDEPPAGQSGLHLGRHQSGAQQIQWPAFREFPAGAGVARQLYSQPERGRPGQGLGVLLFRRGLLRWGGMAQGV